MSVVIAILVFFTIILIHELGHFIAAKACGIYVKDFSFGFGPAILKKKGKETQYTLRLLPLGGYCEFLGDYGEGENGENGEKSEPNPRAYNNCPVWQRIIVILAGPLMNLVLGFLVVMIMMLTMNSLSSRVIYSFYDGSVSSGLLEKGDEIINIEGMSIFTSTDISYKLQTCERRNENGNLIADIKVRRNGETVSLKDVEFMTNETDDGKSKVFFDFIVVGQPKNFKTVITETWRESCSSARLILLTFFDLVRGKYGLNQLSGPVGMGTIISEAVSSPKYKPEDLFYIISLITINLGIFNLLPIPSLDGAKLVFLLIELFRKKPVKPEVEGMIHAVGIALTLVLIVFATFNDISKLVTGGFGL